jgi:Putative Actinobacterial Holin-X, holin superfamily III
MRPALELRDLLDQVRELARVELSLFRAEIGERTSGIPLSLLAVVVGGVLLCVALGLVLVAASLSAALRAASRPRVSPCR